jgi:hypothetical protein
MVHLLKACVVTLLPLASAYNTPPLLRSHAKAPSASFSRRALLTTTPGLALLGAASNAGAAPITDGMERMDALTLALQQSRAEFELAPQLLESAKWDAVRKLTTDLLPLLTFSGYRGESVKSRANAWLAAGEEEKSRAIAARRIEIAKNVNRLEIGLYNMQSGKGGKTCVKGVCTYDTKDMQEATAGIIAALDALLPLMGCEQRWQSGKCEILPKDRSVTSLISQGVF